MFQLLKPAAVLKVNLTGILPEVNNFEKNTSTLVDKCNFFPLRKTPCGDITIVSMEA